MKIRQGFVSNSSSSSFIIYGACMDKYQLQQKLGIDDTSKEYDDWVYNLAEKMGINGVDDGYDYVYLGLDPRSMDEDETLRQFKHRVVAEFKKNGFEIAADKIGWHDGVVES